METFSSCFFANAIKNDRVHGSTDRKGQRLGASYSFAALAVLVFLRIPQPNHPLFVSSLITLLSLPLSVPKKLTSRARRSRRRRQHGDPWRESERAPGKGGEERATSLFFFFCAFRAGEKTFCEEGRRKSAGFIGEEKPKRLREREGRGHPKKASRSCCCSLEEVARERERSRARSAAAREGERKESGRAGEKQKKGRKPRAERGKVEGRRRRRVFFFSDVAAIYFTLVFSSRPR